MTRLLLFALLAFALAATPVAAQEVRAEEPKQPTVSADGTEVLLYLLDRAKIKPVRADEVWNLNDLSNVIVISLGDPNWSRRGGNSPLHMARRVIQFGGASLVASDSQVWFSSSFENARSVNGDTMIPTATVYGGNRIAPNARFLDNKYCPFIVPIDPPPNKLGAEWNLFTGLERIASNRPSYLVVPQPRAEFGSLLATFPKGCVSLSQNLDVRDVTPEAQFFAVGGSGMHPNYGRNYRFLALSDPSIFINQMMLANDANGRTDNLEFAARVVTFLAEEETGRRRTRCLFYQNGEIVEDFSKLRGMMQPPLPLPNVMAMQDKLTDFGNKVIDRFQTSDISNKFLVGSTDEQRDQRFKYIMRGILAILLFRAVWYVLRRSWIAKRPADGPPPPSGGLPPPRPKEKPRALFDRRQKELLRRNNIYEPVRMIIREMFLEAGAPEDPGKRLPEVEISDVVARPDTLVDALTDLWKIAYGPARVVTVQRWRLLEPLFERVRQAHADGKWRFV